MTQRNAAIAAAVIALMLAACGGSRTGQNNKNVPLEGGPVSGAADTHCSLADGGTIAQAINLASCDPNGVDQAGSEYGETMYNASGNDDDCKLKMSWSATPITENADVFVTLTVTRTADGTPFTGAPLFTELMLGTTHPAPYTGPSTTEISPGVYKVGPLRFDQPGEWTMRFHLYPDCADVGADSPHTHGAFYVQVP